jgi:hypothetical protein
MLPVQPSAHCSCNRCQRNSPGASQFTLQILIVGVRTTGFPERDPTFGVIE